MRSVTVTTFLSGNHFSYSFCQFRTKFGGQTTTAGYESRTYSNVAIACKVFPNPMSSAIKHLFAWAAYLTPARWYGRSGSPATSMSASTERDCITDSSCVSFSFDANWFRSAGIGWLNFSAHSMHSVKELIGARQAIVFACQVTLGIALTALTFTGS